MHLCFPVVKAVVFTFPPAGVNEMEKTLGGPIQWSGTRVAVKGSVAFERRSLGRVF